MAWLLFALACSNAGATAEAPAPEAASAIGSAAATPEIDPFSAWLAAPIPVAGGFQAPVRGWDRCGSGCWEQATPGPIASVAAGRVVEVGEDRLVTEHLWYDDQLRHTARITYIGVSPGVAPGQDLVAGVALGTATRVQLQAPALGDLDEFLSSRPRLPVPQAEPVLAVISHALQRMQLYEGGVLTGTYEVGFGQAEGDKEVRGDNRTPKGVYFVVAKSTGPFSGPTAAFFGGHWIKLGYPNAWDAARGVDAGLFGVDTQRAITRAYWSREEPLQGTRLGGGIGLHGWAYEWSNDDPRGLSWGCVVLHLSDVAAIYAALKPGAMVALL